MAQTDPEKIQEAAGVEGQTSSRPRRFNSNASVIKRRRKSSLCARPALGKKYPMAAPHLSQEGRPCAPPNVFETPLQEFSDNHNNLLLENRQRIIKSSEKKVF